MRRLVTQKLQALSPSSSTKNELASSSSRRPSSSARDGYGSTLYPLHPPDTQVLVRISGSDLTAWDRLLVSASSLLIVGSVLWVPALLVHVYRRWKRIPAENQRKRAMYATLILTAIALCMFGPHRRPQVGKWMRVRHWKLWDAWLRFIAFEVIADIQPPPGDRPCHHEHSSSSSASSKYQTSSSVTELLQKIRHDPGILFAFVPHGIFPFGIAFGVLPEIAARRAFGYFRPVAATATQFFPIVSDLLQWVDVIDASRDNVHRALSSTSSSLPSSSSSSSSESNGNFRRRLGLVPGGIAEIFQGYPKPNTHPDEEYAIIRKGFLRMALQHNVAVVPVYCFGATKMLRRLQLPAIVEQLSNFYRISICIFYGVCGLPIPFRQRLLYVIGNPIVPPPSSASSSSSSSSVVEPAQVDEMHQQFCEELHRIFDRHKEAYGWGHKSLQLISR
jgi:Diacylglycerol acyltransferase